jgi:uncharacterized protein (UPF0548 family)
MVNSEQLQATHCSADPTYTGRWFSPKGDRSWGFAYGTLPGHPEQGEEAFVVSLDPEGSVRFEIRAFSRPASRLVELSGPIGRSVQRRATEGYLASLIRHVSG